MTNESLFMKVNCWTILRERVIIDKDYLLVESSSPNGRMDSI
ncbi:MAG TPA: hypothetical protein PKV44_02870 [Bacillota bacterium]|nr:hypothetical protein [Bacillota bacterium]HPE38793.1 hypothetical protein [Bacillota bacterium]